MLWDKCVCLFPLQLVKALINSNFAQFLSPDNQRRVQKACWTGTRAALEVADAPRVKLLPPGQEGRRRGVRCLQRRILPLVDERGLHLDLRLGPVRQKRLPA